MEEMKDFFSLNSESISLRKVVLKSNPFRVLSQCYGCAIYAYDGCGSLGLEIAAKLLEQTFSSKSIHLWFEERKLF